VIVMDPRTRQENLANLVRRVKHNGRGRRYDCIVGLSGGVDSSWVLVNAVRLGLRPLAVHMDNGWNSELAQNNIANLVRGLGVDLYTHVIDWQEYRGLMQAFFDADVIDVELLYDNAMLAVNYEQSLRHGVKHMLSGANHATEGMPMPQGWSWCKFDKRNIYAIAKKSDVRVSTFPSIGTARFLYLNQVRGIKWEWFLDHLPYVKETVVNTLQSEFGYKPYPYKHYESIFTRFYQGFILPKKFGVDKRLVHFSTLIISGQMTREDALRDLERIPYRSQDELTTDTTYFLKKMGWSQIQLDDYLQRPGVPHNTYASEANVFESIRAWRDRWRG